MKPNHADTFPVGARVTVTDRYPGKEWHGREATVVNHSPLYIHIQRDGQPGFALVAPEEIRVLAPKPRASDVNRVYFHYNGKHRSGILNKIEVHRNTGNVLMWVREDGTGDLKAFDLTKIGYTGAQFGLDTQRQVLVEGMFAREAVNA